MTAVLIRGQLEWGQAQQCSRCSTTPPSVTKFKSFLTVDVKSKIRNHLSVNRYAVHQYGYPHLGMAGAALYVDDAVHRG